MKSNLPWEVVHFLFEFLADVRTLEKMIFVTHEQTRQHAVEMDLDF